MKNTARIANVTPDFEAFFARQREDYGQSLRRRIGEIVERWEQYTAKGRRADALELLTRMAHSLAGSAGVFGFDEIGRAARVLEHQLDALPAARAENEMLVEATLAALRALAGTLH